MTVVITRATEADGPLIASLLAAAGLPTEGLADHLATALVGRDGAAVVASAALELYGDTALLRSVAVTPSARGRGLGQRIARAALDVADEHGARSVYLFTTTAGDFFARHFGFRPSTRAAVPTAVQQSVEFTSACPATALVMVRDIAR
jgi:amino-acid N-acetyltransferase